MSKLRKIVLILIGAVVTLVLVVLIGRNIIIKTSVSPMVRSLTGFDASVGGVSVGVFSSKIAIQGLKMTNPSDFAEKRMLDAPEIYVEYKLPSMLSRTREFPKIRLKIAEVVVVKNEKGESNVARIMAVKPKSEGGGGSSSAGNHFGELDLSLGSVIMIDYSRMNGGRPLTIDRTLNYHCTYHNLSGNNLKKVVMLETLKYLPGKLADITPDSIQRELGGVVSASLGVSTNVTGAAIDAAKGLGGMLQSRTSAPARSR